MNDKDLKLYTAHIPNITCMRADVWPGMRLQYLASPYIHSDPKVVEARVAEMEQITAQIIVDEGAKGIVPFSPVVYSHRLGMLCDPPLGWYHFMLTFLDKCESMIVIQQNGWEESQGVLIETAFAQGRDIPTWYKMPELWV